MVWTEFGGSRLLRANLGRRGFWLDRAVFDGWLELGEFLGIWSGCGYEGSGARVRHRSCHVFIHLKGKTSETRSWRAHDEFWVKRDVSGVGGVVRTYVSPCTHPDGNIARGKERRGGKGEERGRDQVISSYSPQNDIDRPCAIQREIPTRHRYRTRPSTY